ncbi:MAG TPA: glucose 1-dehydrogenase [Acidimicrobiales bacterium]|nr:glucose 1-dehydrogenase [Acidimicrobiales bacterium]
MITVGTDPFSLTDRVAIVTGGSRGIGRAVALGFAERGAKVVVASRTASANDSVVKEIEAAGGDAVGVAVDMADTPQLASVVAAAIDAFGRLDILVNNAADSTLSTAADVDAATWDRVHAVNSKGPMFLAQAALPHLEASGHGSIINVLSVGAWNGGPRMILYRSSKSALLGTTMVLAKEWGPRNVRVNAIVPGPFETDMIDWMDEASRARTIAATAQNRIADVSELVPAAVYLASDASSFVTGSVLRIDGGMLSF